MSDEAPTSPAELIAVCVRGVRRELGLTRDDVAVAAGYSRSVVEAVERGDGTASLAGTMAVLEVVGVSVRLEVPG